MEDMVRPGYPPYTDAGELSDVGDLTCPTCHNLHKWYPNSNKKGPGINVEGRVTDSFLRKGLLTEFCIDCHSYDALYRMKYFHTPRSRKKLDPPSKYEEVEAMVKAQRGKR